MKNQTAVLEALFVQLELPGWDGDAALEAAVGQLQTPDRSLVVFAPAASARRAPPGCRPRRPPGRARAARPEGRPGSRPRPRSRSRRSAAASSDRSTRAGPGSKNCRCRRSACSSISRACAHIQVRGSRDRIGSFLLRQRRTGSAAMSRHIRAEGGISRRGARDPIGWRAERRKTVHRDGREGTRRKPEDLQSQSRGERRTRWTAV